MTPDPRFYVYDSDISLAELAELIGAEVVPPGRGLGRVRSVSILSRAGEGDITFLTDKRYLTDLSSVAGVACLVTPGLRDLLPITWVGLVTRHPQAAYAQAANRLVRLRGHEGSEHVSTKAKLEPDVVIGLGVVVGQDAHIGQGTVIGANTVIGPGVTIGRNCVIGSNVSIDCALLGDRVQVASGAVVGSAGFGAAAGPNGIVDIPQLGRVILQDGVTLGAGCTIDRGAFEDTVIGENTKLDNLVHIAHNVRVGRNCVMAAYSGISGSSTVGDGCRFGGRAGVADHISIGDGAQIGAGAAVFKDVPNGETWSGYPARPLRQWLRDLAWLAKSSTKQRSGPAHD
jgi:UDP-3-O-[3-hydroxymyristoyl] glucosamine N-acyltransferase